jgi:hypothetical protein
LDGLEDLHAQNKRDEFTEGGVVLFARLFGLMVLLIGEVLALRLLSNVWPAFPLNNVTLGNRWKNGKTN